MPEHVLDIRAFARAAGVGNRFEKRFFRPQVFEDMLTEIADVGVVADGKRAFHGRNLPRKHFEQRGLSRAVGPDHGDFVSPGHRKTQVGKHRHSAIVRHRYPFRFKGNAPALPR